MRVSTEIISSKYKLIAINDEKCIWYRGGKLYSSPDIVTQSKQMLFDLFDRIPNSVIKRLKSTSKTIQRVLRLEPRAFAWGDNGEFCFAFNREIFIFDNTGTIINRTEIRSEMRNPLQIIYISRIQGFKEGFAYGEYGWNNDRKMVNIMQFNGAAWEVMHTFSSETICHIHSLLPDRNNRCVYIMTGDRDEESGIWKATDGFKQVKPLLTGKQCYRSCAAIISNNGIMYATDTPIEHNYLYESDLNSQLKVVAELEGSVINSIRIQNEWWFVTAVEQDPNLPKLLHYISMKKGPGIKDRYVHVYRMKNNHLDKITKYKKDLLPMWLFQFGNATFVQNIKDSRVFLNPIAVRKYGQKTIEIKIED